MIPSVIFIILIIIIIIIIFLILPFKSNIWLFKNINNIFNINNNIKFVKFKFKWIWLNAWSKSLQSGCNIRLKSCGSRCHPRAAGQDTRPRTWGPDTRPKSLELDRVAKFQWLRSSAPCQTKATWIGRPFSAQVNNENNNNNNNCLYPSNQIYGCFLILIIFFQIY